MKREKILFILFVSLLTNSCGGQTVQYRDMKESNINIPVMEQYHNGLNVFLDKDSVQTVYLTDIYKGEGVEFSPLNGEANLIISYVLRRKLALSQSGISVSAVFILEEDGRYRIMESSYVGSAAYRKSEADMWEVLQITPPQPEEPHFIGYSDDSTLYSVQVLKYVCEHSINPVVYDENQVDQRASFINCNNKFITSDTEKEIEKWIHNPPEYYLDKLSLNGIKGEIKLSFFIQESGKAAHIKVEQTSINKPEALPNIYREISYVLKSIHWLPAQLDSKAVIVKRKMKIKI